MNAGISMVEGTSVETLP